MSLDLSVSQPAVYSLSDYRVMFDLSADDFNQTIMNGPAGFSSFNAEMTAQGYSVLSADPAYDLSYQAILTLLAKQLSIAEKTLQNYLTEQSAQLNKSADYWRSLSLFLDDYQKNADTRYCSFNGPSLSADEKEAHYCMLKGSALPIEHKNIQLLLLPYYFFHSENTADELYHAITNWMIYVEEVRIFPVHDEYDNEPETLAPLLLALQNSQYGVEVRAVNYQSDSKGSSGHAMLRVWRRTCEVK